MNRMAKWDITSECNLKCKHCYNSERYSNGINGKRCLSNQQIFKIVQSLKELEFTKIHFLGGEPLLSPNIVTAFEFLNEFPLLNINLLEEVALC